MRTSSWLLVSSCLVLGSAAGVAACRKASSPAPPAATPPSAASLAPASKPATVLPVAGQPKPASTQPDPHEGHDHAQATPLTPPENGTAYPRPKPGEEPKVVFDKMSHDFGELREGVEAPVEFGYRNEGPGPLKILNTHATCGCTLGEIRVGDKPYAMGDPIAPGASGIVKAVLRTQGFHGTKDTQIDVLTNDPSVAATPDAPFGKVSLKLHANIIRMFEFEGNVSAMNIGSLSNAIANERSLTVRSTRNEPFQVVGFDPPPADVLLGAEPVDATATQWKITMTVPAGLPLGTFTKQIRILTKPESANLTFTAVGSIRGAIDVAPATGAIFGIVPRGQVVAKDIVLSNGHPSASMKLTDIRLVDPKDYSIRSGGPGRPLDAALGEHILLKPVENEPGKVATIQIVIRETMPVGSFSALLVIETGVPEGPSRVMIPIHGFVK